LKTLIVGMGLIGVMHGYCLARGGVSVTHKVRPGRAKDFAGGVEIDALDNRGGAGGHFKATYAPRIVEEVSPDDGYELVMVPTKEYQAVDAVKDLKGGCPDAQFLIFTANWKGPAELDALLDRERYLHGYSVCAGGYDGKTVMANLAPIVRLGEWGGRDTPRLKAIIELFAKGGFKAEIKRDMIQWLWVHQGINSGMIGTALYAGGLEAMASDRKWLDFMVRAVRESLSVVAARGVDLSAYPDAAPFLDDPSEQTVETYYDMLNNTEAGRRTVSYGHFNSNRKEMQHFFCQVYETAKDMNLATPLMDEIDQGIGGC
jgi:2-dehydropantoate 2-reductase